MLKNVSRLEHVSGQNTYHFFCDMDAPIEGIKNALFHFLKYVGQVEDYVKAQEKPKEEVNQEPEVTEEN